MSSDLVLYDRWRTARDAEAFRELVLRYADMVYATCRRITGDPSTAEDVAQDCFLRLAEGHAPIRTSVAGWLHASATCRSLDKLRAEQRRERLERKYAESSSPPEIVWDDLQPRIDSAIDALPDHLKEVIALHFLQGKTQKEIAESLGVSRKTILRRVQQGIESVRTTLKKSGLPIGAGAFVTLLEQHAVEAAPVSLRESLGKLAVSGAPELAAAPAGISALLTKWTVAAVFLFGTIAVSVFLYASQDPQVATMESELQQAETREVTVQTTTNTNPSNPQTTSTSAAQLTTNNSLPPTPVATASIAGSVMDERLQPIGGASLQVSIHQKYPSLSPRLYTATTGEDGSYTVSDIEAQEEVAVRVFAEGFADTAEAHELKPGDTKTGVNFTLSPGITLLGRVLSPGGTPLPGATILPSDIGIADRSISLNEGAYVLVSDNDGLFRLGARPASDGENSISFLQIAAPGVGAGLFQDIAFVDGELIDFRLSIPATIRGRVAFDDGRPASDYLVLSKAMIKAEYDEQGLRSTWHSLAFTTRVDSDGNYVFNTLPPDFPYSASLFRPDGKWLRTMVDETPKLTPGASHAININLEPQIRIAGKVLVKGTQEAFPKATVWAIRQGVESDSAADFEANADGYELLVPNPGRYLIYAEHEVMFNLIYGDTSVDTSAYGKFVDLKTGDDLSLDLELPVPSKLPIRVIDASGGPMPSAQIELSWPSSEGNWVRTARTLDSDGRYLWFCQPEREVWICAVADGYLRTCSEHIQTEQGKTHPKIVLQLAPSATLKANIVIPEGIPIEGGIRLRVTYADGSSEELNEKIFGGGEYIAQDAVRAGAIEVTAIETGSMAAHQSQTVQITVAPGAVYDLGDLVMR